VDADREPFRLALDVPPHVIKPNKYELLQLLGLPQDTNDSELPALCRPFIGKGVEFAALSMGKDGAMFFTSKRSARAKALPVKVLSTVGAGDSMVGAIAFALSRRLAFEETAKLAMACSIGAVTTKGTNPPSKELVDELLGKVTLEEM
jgi:1-phosphofructokinase